MSRKVQQLRVSFRPGATVIAAEAKNTKGSRFRVGGATVKREPGKPEQYRKDLRKAIQSIFS